MTVLGLTYCGTLQAHADTSNIWGLSPNTGYVNTSLKIDCSDTTITPFPGGDADHDGICDHWEDQVTYGPGLHIRFNSGGSLYTYDLSCTGGNDCPSSTHKDVYLELDWMIGHAPDQNAVSDVVNVFANSPTVNIDGVTGVRLHVQRGENPTDLAGGGNVGVHQTSLKFKTAFSTTNPGFWVLKQNRFGTIAERTTTDPNHNSFCASGESAFNCLTAKRQVFHYMVFIHALADPGYTTSSGYSEIFGNDGVVSLGTFTNGVGSIDQQEGSLMHELGHNLGLNHGGGAPPNPSAPEEDNCKPNYLSVMSYSYQFSTTVDLCRPLDYSRINLSPVLNESRIDESIPLGSYTYPNPLNPPSWLSNPPACFGTEDGHQRIIAFSGPSGSTGFGRTGGTVDWNMASSPSIYAQNINHFGACPSTTNSVLTSHDDWNGLGMNFTFIKSSWGASGNTTGSAGPQGPSKQGGEDEGEGDVCVDASPTEIGSLYYSGYVDSGGKDNFTTILSKYGGSMNSLNGTSVATVGQNNEQILMPSIYDPTGNLTSMANEIGGKYVPKGIVLKTPDVSNFDKSVVVYKIPGEQGNPDEGACTGGHPEITTDTVRQIHTSQLQDLKTILTSLPADAIKDSKSEKNLESYVDDAVKAVKSNDPWKAVYKLGLLKTATDGTFKGDSSDDVIIGKEAQAKIYPVVQENMDRFIVEGTVPNMTNTSSSPVLTGNRVDTTAHISWTVSQPFGPVVAGYKIERNLGSGFVTISQSSQPDKTQYDDPNLVPGTYNYRVSAINSFGVLGNPSNEVQITIGGIDTWAWIIMVVIIAILVAIIIRVTR